MRSGPTGHATHMTTLADTARRAHRSDEVSWLAKAGLASQGLIHILIGVIALQIAFGNSGGRADAPGAFASLADSSFGRLVLVALALGCVAYAIWRGLEGAVGRRENDGAERTAKRATSLFLAAVYLVFAVLIVLVLNGGGSASGNAEQSTTARVLQESGGRLLVGAVGLAIIGVGALLVYRGATRKFREHLDARAGGLVDTLGVAGNIGRGVVIALAGIFLGKAALESDAGEARGLDATLRELADQSYGTVMLTLAAIGLLAYGAFSLCEVRFRRT